MYQCFVWLGLVPNCLQRLSADDTKRQELIFHSTLLISCCFSAFLWFSTHLSLFIPCWYYTLLSSWFCSFSLYTLLLLCCLVSTVISQLFLSLFVPLYISFPSIPCCCSVVLSLLFFPSCFFLFSFPCTYLSLLYPAAALLSYLYCSFPTASFSSRSFLHIFPFYTLLLLCCLISTVLSQLLLSLLIPLLTSFPSIPCCYSVVLSLLFFPSCFFLLSFPSKLLSLLYPAAALSSYPLYCSFPDASFSSRSPLHFFPFYTLLLLCHLIPSTVLSQLLLSPLVPLFTSFPSIPCCCSVI